MSPSLSHIQQNGLSKHCVLPEQVWLGTLISPLCVVFIHRDTSQWQQLSFLGAVVRCTVKQRRNLHYQCLSHAPPSTGLSHANCRVLSHAYEIRIESTWQKYAHHLTCINVICVISTTSLFTEKVSKFSNILMQSAQKSWVRIYVTSFLKNKTYIFNFK